MKRFMLMCCTCGRMLKADGTTTAPSPERARGMLDFSDVATFELYTFDDRKEGEAFAAVRGWGVVDANHKCPTCIELSATGTRHGAILETSLLT